MEGPYSSVGHAESSDDISDSERSESPVRQNKYGGPDSSWRSFTENERALTASLLRLRDQDLALHLYNAHSMKRSNYDVGRFDRSKPWTSKNYWLKDRPTEDEYTHSWVPPKSWTAWPMIPEDVPRTGETIGPEDQLDAYTLSRFEEPRPSRELEEVLTSIIEFMAKERFNERDWEPMPQEHPSPIDEWDRKIKEDAERWAAQVPIPASPASDTVSANEKSLNDKDGMHLDGDEVAGSDDSGNTKSMKVAGERNESDIGVDATNTPSNDSQAKTAGDSAPDGDLQRDAVKKEEEQHASEKTELEQHPIICADEDRSRELIRPIIRSTLSRLDELLMALHHARQTCIYYGSGSESQASQYDDETENSDDIDIQYSKLNAEAVKQKMRGRPRKIFQNVELSNSKAFDLLNDDQQAVENLPSKRRVGRPKKVYEPLDGETEQEMLLRIARLQKKPLPFVANQQGKRNYSSPRKDHVGGSRRRRSTSRNRRKRRNHLHLRDWSEVMGTAALVGFPPDVIARATQRCATLFGEAMDMRALVETPETKLEQDDIIRYVPDAIPDLSSTDSEDTDIEVTDVNDAPKIRARPIRRKRSQPGTGEKTDEPKYASIDDDATFWCPIVECIRHDQGFRNKWHLRSHLKRTHEWSDAELDQDMQATDDEMEGGVHVDGFLKIVKGRSGWRGADATQRERSRKGLRKDRRKTAKTDGGDVTIEDAFERDTGDRHGSASDYR